MKSRIAYIILFLTSFIFPSIAQDSYVEYEYVDGTKETDIISFDRLAISLFMVFSNLKKETLIFLVYG